MADISAPANRVVSLGEALPLYLKNYAKFQGRSSRGAYWWSVLLLSIISIAASVIDLTMFSALVAQMGGTGPVGVIISLATVIPSIAIAVRRLHDVGRSGWWYLIAFTVIGILLLIYWWAQPGQRQENAFGADAEAGR